MTARPLLLWLLLVVLALSACATTVPPPIGAGSFTPEAGEAALRAEAGREAGVLVQRVRPYTDPALSAYLLDLSRAPVLGAGAPELRVEIVRDPTLNAFALPDGRLIVHTGLLAAVGSAEQLALILAREVAHVTERHALGASRTGRLRPASDEDRGILGPVAAALIGLRLPVAATASLTGYGAALERRADEVAIARLIAAGVDLGPVRTAYASLARDEAERDTLEVFLLGRPAWRRERHESLGELLDGAPGASARRPPAGSAEFESRLRPVVRENAAEDIRQGRFALAAQALTRVIHGDSTDAVAHLYYGDLHRLQSQQAISGPARATHAARASSFYRLALELDPSLAAAHRQLGLLHYQLKDVAQARAEFERYLALAPGAPDAARVAEYVRELAR